MIDFQDISSMENDEEFKKTKKISQNLKHSKKTIQDGKADLSLSFSITPDSFGIGISCKKLIFSIGKRFIIAHEVGVFKCEVIKRAFEYFPEHDEKHIDFESIIASDYFWLEEDFEKMELLKNIIKQYLTDARNKSMIIGYCSNNITIEEKSDRYDKVVDLIDREFSREIGNIIKRSQRDMSNKYYKYIVETEKVDKILVDAATKGYLTTDVEGDKNGN